MSFVPRLYLPELNRGLKKFRLGDSPARYLIKVLRFKAGDKFLGFDAAGEEYELTLLQTELGQTEARVVGVVEKKKEDRIFSIALAQGLPKGSKMDSLLRQCTEAGVDRFIPLVTQRSISRPDESSRNHKSDRWGKILVEACRQSGRSLVPRLDPITEWKEGLELISNFDLALMPYEKEAPALKSVLKSIEPPRQVLILVGPEGGWSREEIGAAEEKGALPVHLPTPTLRTETAGIAIVSMLRYHWESTSDVKRGES